ncbi:MAG: AAA family ATPase [Saprospiraceae bacterium]|nr:AAA family ATPase [Saprospiraceae bacterium]
MPEFTPQVLTPAFQEILDLLESGNDTLFVTGQAGTGKSTLLRLFHQTTSKKIVITAPTGVAALQAGGQTIHSFFQFPPHLFGPSEVRKGRFKKLYQAMEILVIDEVSMVRSDIMDRIDLFLQINRNNSRPFGGVRLALFGDLFQLPPVVRKEEGQMLQAWGYPSPYFFDAKAFQTSFSWRMVELQEVFRQKDRYFLRLLDEIRTNRADADTLEALNARVGQMDGKDENLRIILAARNAKVDQINSSRLNALEGVEQTYMAKVTGSFNEQVFPTDPLLRLRVGAQVMFIRNDPEGAFVNGTLGLVTRLEPDKVEVTVRKAEGREEKFFVEPVSWELFRYTPPPPSSLEIGREVVGTFSQMPLRLAWAVTIHKSQGQTFDQVQIDLTGGMFEHGQLYVALSRCRTLEGITLTNPIRPGDIRVDPRISEFYMDRVR